MEKLYYENPYIKDFTAEIINVIQKNDEYHVELDKTCFYPEGGGQPNDIGYIDSNEVIYVYDEDGHIYHVVKVKPIKIHRVKCTINWDRRYDYMQQHLGQHILSACFVKLFNANTIGFHLGVDYVSIDIDKVIGNEEIATVEKMANEIIDDNIKIEILYPSKQELRKLSLKKLPANTNEQIRIVKISDIDINPCCGTHPSSTCEVRAIKVIKNEKYKTGLRIYFLSGKRAIADYMQKHDLISKISKILSCKDTDIMDQVSRLSENLNAALSEKRSLKAEVANYEVLGMLDCADSIKDIKIIKKVYDGTDYKYVDTLSSKLTAFPNVIVLFGVTSAEKAQLIFACSKDLKLISMNTLLKDAITLIDGKGGGNDFSAQGGGKNNNNLDSTLEYAYNKIKDCIL